MKELDKCFWESYSQAVATGKISKFPDTNLESMGDCFNKLTDQNRALLQRQQSDEGLIRELVESLGRTRESFCRAVTNKPIRDMDEILAECDAIIQHGNTRLKEGRNESN